MCACMCVCLRFTVRFCCPRVTRSSSPPPLPHVTLSPAFVVLFVCGATSNALLSLFLSLSLLFTPPQRVFSFRLFSSLTFPISLRPHRVSLATRENMRCRGLNEPHPRVSVARQTNREVKKYSRKKRTNNIAIVVYPSHVPFSSSQLRGPQTGALRLTGRRRLHRRREDDGEGERTCLRSFSFSFSFSSSSFSRECVSRLSRSLWAMSTHSRARPLTLCLVVLSYVYTLSSVVVAVVR